MLIRRTSYYYNVKHKYRLLGYHRVRTLYLGFSSKNQILFSMRIFDHADTCGYVRFIKCYNKIIHAYNIIFNLKSGKCRFFTNKVFQIKTRETKVREYSIVRPTLTYGGENVRPRTVRIIERELCRNTVLRTIRGPVFDAETNGWRRRRNEGNLQSPSNSELRKGTKNPTVRAHNEETNEVRATIEYEPTGRRPGAKKRCTSAIKDLEGYRSNGSGREDRD